MMHYNAITGGASLAWNAGIWNSSKLRYLQTVFSYLQIFIYLQTKFSLMKKYLLINRRKWPKFDKTSIFYRHIMNFRKKDVKMCIQICAKYLPALFWVSARLEGALFIIQLWRHPQGPRYLYLLRERVERVGQLVILLRVGQDRLQALPQVLLVELEVRADLRH